MEDHVMVVPSFPIDETSVISESFLLIPKKAETAEERKHFQLNHDIFWQTIAEDNEMNRLQQQSFNGFDDFSITIGGFETLILQFEELVQQAIKKELQITDSQ